MTAATASILEPPYSPSTVIPNNPISPIEIDVEIDGNK